MSMRKNIIALSLFNAAKLLKEAEDPMAAEPSVGGDVPTDPQTGEALTLEQMIDRVNIIRSGLSFEDPEVFGKLTSLYKAMPADEKIKFNKQLKDIGAVVQNQEVNKGDGAPPEAPAPPPEAAPAPAAPPSPAAPPPPPPAV